MAKDPGFQSRKAPTKRRNFLVAGVVGIAGILAVFERHSDGD